MISSHAVVQSDDVADSASIGEFAVVREGASIGEDAVIHPHVVIETGVVVGNEVEVFPGAYLGKEPKGAGAIRRTPRFERGVVIGPQTLLGDGASIREQCRIGSSCLISKYVTINYNTTVGDRTKIMDNSHITGNCTIGSDVFIAPGVSSSNDNAIGGLPYDEELVVGPTIRDGAAIGVGAILLPGIEIGERAIVAGGAVATKDVEPDTLVMGVPARFVRRLDATASEK